MEFAAAATGGYIGGNIAAVVCLLLCIGAVIVGFRMRYDGALLIVPGAIGIVVTAGVWLWASWPLSYEYHHWMPKTATVTRKVESRFIGDGDGGTTQKFVIVADGTYYGVNDTRAAVLEPGDRVSLKCKRAYDFGVPRSAHGWDCKWAGAIR